MKTSTVSIFFVMLIIGITGTSAATFGLGKFDTAKRGSTYQICEVATIIGTLMTFTGLVGLSWGAFSCRSSGQRINTTSFPQRPF